MNLHPGDTVILIVPENPRLHRQLATIETLEEWGAHTLCSSAGSGRFRALWEEMEIPFSNGVAHGLHANIPSLGVGEVCVGLAVSTAKDMGYTGSFCTQCGSDKMKRNGTCELCMDCGSTSGCS